MMNLTVLILISSSVGVYINSGVEIIANEKGNRLTPNYVAFNDEEQLVGEDAKNQAHINPMNTVHSVTLLLGRNFSEITSVDKFESLPFKIIEKEGNPVIQVNFKGERIMLKPEEIAAMIIIKMKELAESYLRENVTHAGAFD